MELNISDFTQDSYRKLLETTKSKYEFSQYHSFNKDSKYVLWRHDLDFSLDYSLDLAKIEAEMGVSSTFFVLPHSRFYNSLETGNRDIIKEIKSLGHEIGLHFDPHFYDITSENELNDTLVSERDFFGNIFDVDIKAFSFHNTTEFTMACQKWNYGGMINTYAAYFQTEVNYCSDSNGYWRFQRMEDFLAEDYDRIQILTHPGWWQKEKRTPNERVKQIAKESNNKVMDQYEKALVKYGRVNAK